MTVTIGVADCYVSNDVNDMLITHSLGSCLAVIVYDPAVRVGGMLHLVLPQSSSEAFMAGKSPYTYADTGIPLLFREVYRNGGEKSRLQVYAAGGAQMIDPEGIFNIGQKNCLAARSILWKAGVMLRREETGGECARTVRLDMSSGRVYLKSPDRAGEREL